jgi:hypothetical protein
VIAEGLLSTHAYSVVSVYCFFNTPDPQNEICTYLCEDQDSILKYFKQTYPATASGKPLFLNKQLQDLSMLLPDADDNPPATPPLSPLLAGIGASRHNMPIFGRVTSRHASHVMTRHHLAILQSILTKCF